MAAHALGADEACASVRENIHQMRHGHQAQRQLGLGHWRERTESECDQLGALKPECRTVVDIQIPAAGVRPPVLTAPGARFSSTIMKRCIRIHCPGIIIRAR